MAAREDFRGLLRRLDDSHADLEGENEALRCEVARLRAALQSAAAGPLTETGSTKDSLRSTAGVGQAKLVDHLRPPDLPPIPSSLPSTDDGVQSVVISDDIQQHFIAPSNGARVPSAERGLARSNTRYTDTDRRAADKQMRRFRELFNKSAYQQRGLVVTSEDLLPILESRGMRSLSEEKVDSWLSEIMKAIGADKRPKSPAMVKSQSCIGMRFDDFVEAMHRADLPSLVSHGAAGIRMMQSVLLKQDVDEVIARLARRTTETSAPDEDELANVESHRAPCLHAETTLQTCVSCAVLTSLACLLLSPDHDPEHLAWLCIELACTALFVVEVLIKHRWYGFREYWCGRERQWNWADAGITLVSVLDIFLEVVVANANASSISLLLVLRCFRFLRIARALKMLRSPLVQELSNMLMGFLIGMPALFWTIVLLSLVVVLVGLCFRLTIGPPYGEPELIPRCGTGDAPLDADGCEPHMLYAEEYCGNVMSCSFTIFRCVIGDCSSKGGQSLAAHLSHGFGARFDVAYLLGMIVIIFGLFNVITAIFVEATMAGLKYNETKQKIEMKYQSMYVEKMLRKLVRRIERIYRDGHGRKSEASAGLSDRHAAELARGKTFDESLVAHKVREISLGEEEFFWVVEDSDVRGILSELDIELEGAAFETLFETMDSNGNGSVMLSEMVDCLMKLRGGPMKVDMIAPWVALRSLKQDVQKLSQVMDKVTSTLQLSR